MTPSRGSTLVSEAFIDERLSRVVSYVDDTSGDARPFEAERLDPKCLIIPYVRA